MSKENFVLTNEQMRRADEYTIKTLGVPSAVLMERAGKALADEAELLAPTGKILCVCGGGNNGGDGFVCARLLRERGREADCTFFAEKSSEDCAAMRKKWLAVGGRVLDEVPTEGADYALVVDCLFGTGFHGAVDGKNAEAVRRINALRIRGAKVLAADIPSGVSGNDGVSEGDAVCADVTLCLGEIKLGAVMNDGLDFSGSVKRAEIGIELPDGDKKDYARLLDRESVSPLLPKRKRNSRKGTYGRCAIVGGSKAYTGAPYLSAAACLRSGAGYTSLFVPEGIFPHYILKCPEALLRPTKGKDGFVFDAESFSEVLSYDAVAYGMGMGVSEEVAKGAKFLLEKYTGKLVLDADGLNSLAKFEGKNALSLLANKKCEAVLTPHVKEYERLTGKGLEEVRKDGVEALRDFGRSTGSTLLLKGAASVITDGRETWLNTTGCSGLAKGGSGDVLSGLIAGLCASGLSVFNGAKVGAYLLGKAAELAGEKIGEYSMTATDVISYLGGAFLHLHGAVAPLFVPENTDENGGKE